MESDGQISAASQEAIDSAERLYNAIQIAYPEAETNFESKWTAWHAVWHSQTTSTSIDACVRTDEFEGLKRLGPKIIPFVVFKLARDAEQNSYGVFLYNAVEYDPDYRVTLGEALVSQEVLWRYSSCIVERNYQRNKIVEERVGAWRDHCQRNHLSSGTDTFTQCEEYWDLLEMGPSIIAHLMVEYHHDEGYKSWHELVHEIIHGRKMGAYMIQKRPLFEEWCRFFNNREHDQAFKYIPTPVDRYIHTGESSRSLRL